MAMEERKTYLRCLADRGRELCLDIFVLILDEETPGLQLPVVSIDDVDDRNCRVCPVMLLPVTTEILRDWCRDLNMAGRT